MKNIKIFLLFGLMWLGVESIIRAFFETSALSFSGVVVMFCIGGLCGLAIGLIDEFIKLKPLYYRLLSGLVACVIELIGGLIFNYNHQIWDWSQNGLHLWGQTGVLPFMAWVILAPIAIVLDNQWRGK